MQWDECAVRYCAVTCQLLLDGRTIFLNCWKAGMTSFWTRLIDKGKIVNSFCCTHKQTKLVKENLSQKTCSSLCELYYKLGLYWNQEETGVPGEYIDIPSLFDRDKKRKLVMSYTDWENCTQAVRIDPFPITEKKHSSHSYFNTFSSLTPCNELKTWSELKLATILLCV
jgi:hypothetical protein